MFFVNSLPELADRPKDMGTIHQPRGASSNSTSLREPVQGGRFERAVSGERDL